MIAACFIAALSLRASSIITLQSGRSRRPVNGLTRVLEVPL
jgi:hypothetical protein